MAKAFAGGVVFFGFASFARPVFPITQLHQQGL